MNSSTRKFNYIFVGSFAALVGGTILLASAQPAMANKGNPNNFRAFREQNADLSRHAARKMFQSERRNHGISAVSPVVFTVSQGPDGIIRCGTEVPEIGKQDRISSSQLRNQSLQATGTGHIIRLSSGVDLDLTSQEKNITLGKNLFSDSLQSVDIETGGKTQTVTAGSQVTAAEYVAVKQALAGGQKVSIDRSGAAVGGEVDLGALTADNDVMRASDLVVPANVITYGDFGKRSDFRLLGDLSNYGTVHATSSDSNVKGGAIRADDIANHSGGVISSTVDLTLDVAGNLSNEGAIVSQQGLTLSAGGSVNNSGSVTAAKDVTFNTSSLNNSGHVRSESGDVNLNGLSTATLAVNNTGGSIEALNGAINVRDTAYSGTFDTTVYGGDLLSRELNLNSGQGLTNVNVGNLTGTVNETGTAAHVMAATDDLKLGNICLTGDPTFYNTAGQISITGNVIVNEALTFVAAGDIAVTGTNVFIAADNGTRGFDATFIAGADFVATGGADSPTVPPLPGTPGAVSLSGKASKLGGGAIIMTSANTVIDVTAISGNNPGGNVVMAAFAGKAANSGSIDLSGTIIQTGGTGTGTSGYIRLIAGKKDGDAVKTGLFETAGGVANPSDDLNGIDIFTSQPTVSVKGATVDYGANGARTSAAEFVTAKKLTKGNVVITDANPGPGVDINANGNSLIDVGGAIVVNGKMQSSGSFDLEASGNITMAPAAGVMAAALEIDLFSSDGSIGEDLNPILINTPLFAADAQTLVNVRDFATGSVTAASVTADDVVKVEVSDSNSVLSGDFRAANITVICDRFSNNFNFANASESIAIQTNDATYTFNGTFTFVPNFTLDVAGDIGAVGNPFQFEGIQAFHATTQRSAFLQQNGKKETNLAVNSEFGTDIQASNSITLGDSDVADGSFNAQTTGGTMTVSGDISAQNNITLTNSSDKGKMVIEGSSAITTDAGSKGPGSGDINITVGPGGQPPLATTPANVTKVEQFGGTVSFFGVGLKAQAPASTLSAIGADVNISNAFKIGNLAFGPSVTITADPPPNPGDSLVKIITYGATKIPHKDASVSTASSAGGVSPDVVSNLLLVPQDSLIETWSLSPSSLGSVIDTIPTLTKKRQATSGN